MELLTNFIYYWADVIWLPILFWGVHKRHRWWALAFGIATMVLVRLIAETITFIGYPNGIMGFSEMPVYTRGMIVNTVFYILFLIMAHFSPKTEGIVFMAACLSIFFMIFVTATLSMLV